MSVSAAFPGDFRQTYPGVPIGVNSSPSLREIKKFPCLNSLTENSKECVKTKQEVVEEIDCSKILVYFLDRNVKVYTSTMLDVSF